MSTSIIEVATLEKQLLKLGLGIHVEDDFMKTSLGVLDIIHEYRLNKVPGATDKRAEGTGKFLTVIYKYVKYGLPIKMCLPAFPWKSANKVVKVLGTLPDKAEELSLAHLNTLCTEIGEFYAPGAKLLIVSDGLVYNDLFTIPDQDVWAYGENLRAMAGKRFEHIEFSRLQDMVNLPLPAKLDEISYVANATNFRRAMLNNYGKDDLDVDKEISENEDTRLTYRGYLRFLESDLQYIFPVTSSYSRTKYKKDIKYIAKEMIVRGYAFSRCIKAKFPEHLRLSIHQSTGEHKLSIKLLPTQSSFTTPWHCCVAIRADGSVTSAPKADFDNDPSFDLILENGRPSFFSEKPHLSA